MTVCPEGVGWVCGVMLSVCLERGGCMCVWRDTRGVCVSGWGWMDVCRLTCVCGCVRRGMDGCVVWLLAFLAFKVLHRYTKGRCTQRDIEYIYLCVTSVRQR